MREKLTDLHCHSVYSDGTCTPEEIVNEAKRIGLSSVALTDHDAIDGIEEFHKAGKKHNIETITGIELAAQHNRFHREEIHIVGLGFDVDSVPLKRLMEQIAIDRDTRNHIIIEELNKHGYNITLEEVLQTSKNGVLMRSHFITLLLQKGYQESREYLFDKFLSVNSRAFKEIDFAPEDGAKEYEKFYTTMDHIYTIANKVKFNAGRNHKTYYTSVAGIADELIASGNSTDYRHRDTDIIPVNPAAKVQKPKSPKYEAKYYDIKQLKMLFDCMQGDRFELMYKMTAFYGLRRSKLCGMQWSSIDFEKNTLTLNHSVCKLA